jgi:hypothetical protein
MDPMARGKTLLSVIGWMFLVGIVHWTIGVFLYYGRVKKMSPVFDSDYVVFIFPAILAYLGYYFIAWHGFFGAQRLMIKMILSGIIALGALSISELCKMMYAFSKYGT